MSLMRINNIVLVINNLIQEYDQINEYNTIITVMIDLATNINFNLPGQIGYKKGVI